MAGAHHSLRTISCSVQYCHHKNATIATVMETSPPNIYFRTVLNGPRLAAWFDLLGRLNMVQLKEGSNVFHWNLNANKNSQWSLCTEHLLTPLYR